MRLSNVSYEKRRPRSLDRHPLTIWSINGDVTGDGQADRRVTVVMVSKVMVSSTTVMIQMPMGWVIDAHESTTVASIMVSGSLMLMLARASKGTYLD